MDLLGGLRGILPGRARQSEPASEVQTSKEPTRADLEGCATDLVVARDNLIIDLNQMKDTALGRPAYELALALKSLPDRELREFNGFLNFQSGQNHMGLQDTLNHKASSSAAKTPRPEGDQLSPNASAYKALAELLGPYEKEALAKREIAKAIRRHQGRSVAEDSDSPEVTTKRREHFIRQGILLSRLIRPLGVNIVNESQDPKLPNSLSVKDKYYLGLFHGGEGGREPSAKGVFQFESDQSVTRVLFRGIAGESEKIHEISNGQALLLGRPLTVRDIYTLPLGKELEFDGCRPWFQSIDEARERENLRGNTEETRGVSHAGVIVVRWEDRLYFFSRGEISNLEVWQKDGADERAQPKPLLKFLSSMIREERGETICGQTIQLSEADRLGDELERTIMEVSSREAGSN